MNLGNLFQRELSRRYNALRSHLLQNLRTAITRDRHLCARMHRKIRKYLPNLSDCTDILHDNGIESSLIVRSQIIRQILKLLFLHQGVDGHVNLFSMQMHIVDRLKKTIFLRIIRIGARSIPASAHIDRICSSADSRLHALHRAGRCQNLYLWSFHHSQISSISKKTQLPSQKVKERMSQR